MVLHVVWNRYIFIINLNEQAISGSAGVTGGCRGHEVQFDFAVLREAVFLLDPTYGLCELESQQKYSVDAIPKTSGKYEVEISNMVDGKWNSIFYKQARGEFESFNIHKLAPADSTYSFCLRNIDDMEMKINANIQSGLELMEF